MACIEICHSTHHFCAHRVAAMRLWACGSARRVDLVDLTVVHNLTCCCLQGTIDIQSEQAKGNQLRNMPNLMAM